MKKVNKSKNRNVIMAGIYGLIGVLILTIILLSVAPGFMLDTFGFRSYVSHYDQMEPTIQQNALVFIDRVDVNRLEEGDLVTFLSNSDLNEDGEYDLVTGYFHHTLGSSYYFRSEGSTSDWAVLQEDSIVGGYGFSIPFAGLVVDFIASPFGIAVVFVNIAIIGGIIYVVKSGKIEKE